MPRRDPETSGDLIDAVLDAAYDDALLFYWHLSEWPGFRDFLLIFMTEGHRRSRHSVSIANSDPAIVRHSQDWMRRLSASDLVYSIQYHADQDLDRYSFRTLDAHARKAVAAGGSTYAEPKDHGFMYQHGFHDPDGHIWEVLWMDPKAIQG